MEFSLNEHRGFGAVWFQAFSLRGLLSLHVSSICGCDSDIILGRISAQRGFQTQFALLI
ncbi:hypothetical protein COLO4_17324 [Corchorus olitorius]|uniref:Uncharacterized protein n=1 Tax=Corchorus olitorius TaxID=93759 RepID=A0A1R3JD69_9ROSI|nr:hypothetical protein COLO4_17324 [Corchorus olitorius]